MSFFKFLHPALLVLIISFILSMATEITTNTATASIFMPIVAQLAVALRLNPLYLMLPTSFAANFSFMLPTATPSNAIAFTTGHLVVFDMVKSGFVLNMLGIGISMAALHTVGEWVYNVHQFPDWADLPTTTEAESSLISDNTIGYNTIGL